MIGFLIGTLIGFGAIAVGDSMVLGLLLVSLVLFLGAMIIADIVIKITQ